MRIFVIPILSNRWAYYCHSEIPSTSRLVKAVDWSSKKWDQLGASPPKSWKKQIHERGSSLMNQLDYQEWFLKSIPTREHLAQPPGKALVQHPTTIAGSSAQHHLETLLQFREPYHKKYMLYSAYWVPVSCLFAIVPLIPNIPLAYNLFRLYSHYKAYKGAQHVQLLALQKNIHYTPSPDIDRLISTTKLASSHDVIFPDAVRQAFVDSPQKPKLAALQDDVAGVLSKQTITQLASELQVPALEIELNRARFQILCAAAQERFN